MATSTITTLGQLYGQSQYTNTPQQHAPQHAQYIALQNQLSQASMFGGNGGLGVAYAPPSARDILNDLTAELNRYLLNYVSIERLEGMIRDLTERVELGAAVAAHVSPEWYARYEVERKRLAAAG